MSNERFLEAAQRVLDGDDSMEAANELKDVTLDEFPDDQQYDELVDVLTRYASDQDDPGTVTEEVRTVIRETIARAM